MVKAASLAFGLSLLCAAPVAADDKSDADLGANAALKYWQAFATLPKLGRQVQPPDYMTHAARRQGQGAGRLRRLLPGADALRRPPCRAASGPSASTRTASAPCCPHCQAARNLAGLAVLRIRLRFEEGKTAEAVDDAVDALTLGRHISTDGTLIGVLVGIAIDQMATDALAADSAGPR